MMLLFGRAYPMPLLDAFLHFSPGICLCKSPGWANFLATHGSPECNALNNEYRQRRHTKTKQEKLLQVTPTFRASKSSKQVG